MECTACSDGYYGQNCSHACSSNCKTCKPTDGTCSCYAGWMGPNCSIGIFVIFNIIQHIKNMPYSTLSYNPILWDSLTDLRKHTSYWFCKLAYYISACIKSYGENCQNPCSTHCINQICHPFNGTCLTKCKDNSYGDKCNTGTLNIFHMNNKCWIIAYCHPL